MRMLAYQQAFTAHLRDPQQAPRPEGVSARRMQVYQRLLFNNVEGFLLACYPVCRKMLGQRRWTRLVRQFFSEHSCTTPYFRHIPAEFLTFLAQTWPIDDTYPDYLPELAHYEWVELDLETSCLDSDLPPHDPEGDFLTERPLLNPVMHILAYVYPVHRIAPRRRVSAAETVHLLAYRDVELAVQFEEINAVTARLLTLIQAGWSSPEAIGQLAGELNHPEPERLFDQAAELLLAYRQRGVILGACRT